MYEARHKAISRMEAECEALGGHGVVSAQLRVGGFPAGGLEFKVIGTAVRADGARLPRLRKPFTSHLTGQDFAKLIIAGWVPVGFALGISVAARHDDWMTLNQTRWGAGNTEVAGAHRLVNQARHDGRVQLERDVARQARGRRRGLSRWTCASATASAPCRKAAKTTSPRRPPSAPLSPSSAPGGTRARPGSLAIMSLDPQRRQAARIRL